MVQQAITATAITNISIFLTDIEFNNHLLNYSKFEADKVLTVEGIITRKDKFIFLPVFYAGGTTSFSPTSEQIVLEYRLNSSKEYFSFDSRKELEKYLEATTSDGDTILVMGARDNSLSTWTEKMVVKRI